MTNPYFPFRALGFCCNPFRALMPDEWAAVAVLPEPVIEVLERGFQHLQIRGRKGRGKSTTLHGLIDHFEEAGLRVAYERLPRGQHHFLTDTSDLDMFFLDEAQRLNWAERWRLVRAVRRSQNNRPHPLPSLSLRRSPSPNWRGEGLDKERAGMRLNPDQKHNLQLVLGTHVDFRSWFAVQGERLDTVSLNIPTHDHLERIIDRRLAAFALDDPPQVTVAPEAVTWLREQYGSDHRAIEDALYRAFLCLDSPGVITPRYLQTVLRESDPGQGPSRTVLRE